VLTTSSTLVSPSTVDTSERERVRDGDGAGSRQPGEADVAVALEQFLDLVHRSNAHDMCEPTNDNGIDDTGDEQQGWMERMDAEEIAKEAALVG
jgi:hypothetical protein